MTSSLFAFTRNILIRVTERDRDKNEKESVYNKSDDYHGCMSDFFYCNSYNICQLLLC